MKILTLVLLAVMLRVQASAVLPEVTVAIGAAAAGRIIEWTIDGGAEYWAGPKITPYIGVAEIVTQHHEMEKGTGVQTTRTQKVASWLGFGPKSAVVYSYNTTIRTIPSDRLKAKVDSYNDPFSWSTLERRDYYCSEWYPRQASGALPTDPFCTYVFFSMRFKLAGYCSAQGVTSQTGPFPTQVVVGRTTRPADCKPFTPESSQIIRGIDIPLSSFVFFEWDRGGNFLYDYPKFLKSKPSPSTVGVSTFPDPRATVPLPVLTPVVTDPNGAANY